MGPASLANSQDQDTGSDNADFGAKPPRVIYVHLDVLKGWSDSEGGGSSHLAPAGCNSSGAQAANETVEVLRLGARDYVVPQHRSYTRRRGPKAAGGGPSQNQERRRERSPKTGAEPLRRCLGGTRQLKYVDTAGPPALSSSPTAGGGGGGESAPEPATSDLDGDATETSDPVAPQERAPPAHSDCPPDSPDTQKLTLSGRSLRIGGLYVCEVCMERFDMLRALLDHERRHQEEKYPCPLCNKRFTLPKLVRKHQRSHRKKSVYECRECGLKFGSQPVLLEHLHSHTGGDHLRCGQCGLLLPDRRRYRAHIRRHTANGAAGAICPLCDGPLPAPGQPELHRCPRQAALACPHPGCDQHLPTERRLLRHLLGHMPTAPPWQCGLCQKQFGTKYSLRNHCRVHSGERPFACQHCAARFALQSNLAMHVRYVHENDRRFRCSQCGRGFKRRRLLRRHEMSHSGRRPVQCPQCPAQMLCPEQLKQHLRTHSGEKPHVCSVCGRTFARVDNLRTHLFTHSSRKPFECRECGAGFMRKMGLVHHMKLMNHGDPEDIVSGVAARVELPGGAAAGQMAPALQLVKSVGGHVVVLLQGSDVVQHQTEDAVFSDQPADAGLRDAAEDSDDSIHLELI